MRRSGGLFVMRMICNTVSAVLVLASGSLILSVINITGYITWGVCAGAVTLVAAVVWWFVDKWYNTYWLKKQINSGLIK